MRRARSGFTLIELLIVVVIIGILASIAIPKFGSTKGKAYLAAMKSDLRNLATAQEAYLYDFATYYQGAVPAAGISYSVTPGVTVTISNVSVSGWAATTSHIQVSQTCAIFIGSATPPAPADTEGQPKCTT
ncbi:MAG: type II secretion system protein [Gemmatimonadetes bacterium]|nr:type II secretion system protein [Gemmatimonadota bacterium]